MRRHTGECPLSPLAIKELGGLGPGIGNSLGELFLQRQDPDAGQTRVCNRCVGGNPDFTWISPRSIPAFNDSGPRSRELAKQRLGRAYDSYRAAAGMSIPPRLEEQFSSQGEYKRLRVAEPFSFRTSSKRKLHGSLVRTRLVFPKSSAATPEEQTNQEHPHDQE